MFHSVHLTVCTLLVFCKIKKAAEKVLEWGGWVRGCTWQRSGTLGCVLSPVLLVARDIARVGRFAFCGLFCWTEIKHIQTIAGLGIVSLRL